MNRLVDVGADWSAVTSCALLGTDRRSPPLPSTPAVVDLLADARLCGLAADAPDELAVSAATLAVVRRAGLTPGAAIQPEAGPAIDERPLLPVATAERWRQIVDQWPVLEDELLVQVGRAGWRLPPDVVVGMLRRHRGDSPRRASVLSITGPLATWLIGRFPELGIASGRSVRATTSSAPLDALPPLAMPPALAALLGERHLDAFAEVLAELRAGRLGAAHRGVLINLCARVRPEVLEPLADALAAVEPSQPTIGLALTLSDLCRTRAAMLQELA